MVFDGNKSSIIFATLCLNPNRVLEAYSLYILMTAIKILEIMTIQVCYLLL